MRKSNLPEETPKGLGWPNASGHVEGAFTSISFHLLEHGDESGAKGEHSSLSLMPLDSEVNHSPVEINIIQKQAGFGKATALLPSDDVAYTHPLRLRLKRIHDLLVFVVGNSGLERWLVFDDAKLPARIRSCVAALDSLVHDKSKQLALVQCGVLACLVAACIWLTVLTPVHEVADVLPGQLAGNVYVGEIEVCTNVPPASDVAVQRPLPIVIPLPQEPLDPSVPHPIVVRAGRSFRHRHFTAESVRLAAFRYNRVPKLCGFLASLPADVSVFNPKKGTAVPLVKSGHIVKKNYAWLRRQLRRPRV